MKSIKKYLITLSVGFLGVLLIVWFKDIFSKTAPVDIFHILCDAFFVVGVVMTGSGLLIFSSNEGTFDAIVFGVGSFFSMFRKNHIRKHQTLYDYRADKAEKKIRMGFLLLCGLFFLAVAVGFYLLYRQYA